MADFETILLVGGPGAGSRLNVLKGEKWIAWEVLETSLASSVPERNTTGSINRVVYERVDFSYGSQPSRCEPMAMFVPSTVHADERGRFCMLMLHEAYPDPRDRQGG